MMARDERLTGSHRGQSVGCSSRTYRLELTCVQMNAQAPAAYVFGSRMLFDQMLTSLYRFATNSVWQTEKID